MLVSRVALLQVLVPQNVLQVVVLQVMELQTVKVLQESLPNCSSECSQTKSIFSRRFFLERQGQWILLEKIQTTFQ